MKRIYFALMTFAVLLSACQSNGNDPFFESENISSAKQGVTFRGRMTGGSRATETKFEGYDQISVFAVRASNELEAEGNYADNVKYTYYSGYFHSTNPISLSENDTKGLAYYAIYPYYQGYTNAFVFVTKEDQSTHDSYTKSDLCTAYCPPTTDKVIDLEFNHRLSNIVVKFSGNNLNSKNIKVEIKDVLTSCTANLNANTFEGIGTPASVIMGVESTNTLHAIIVPQKVEKEKRG